MTRKEKDGRRKERLGETKKDHAKDIDNRITICGLHLGGNTGKKIEGAGGRTGKTNWLQGKSSGGSRNTTGPDVFYRSVGRAGVW